MKSAVVFFSSLAISLLFQASIALIVGIFDISQHGEIVCTSIDTSRRCGLGDYIVNQVLLINTFTLLLPTILICIAVGKFIVSRQK